MRTSLIFCSLHEIQSWRIVARPPDNLQRALPFQLESCINHKLKHSLIIYVWLFHLHNMVKMQPFYPVSPLSESIAEAFCWLFLWGFKEKASTIFYGTAKNKASTVSYRTAKDKSGRPCQRAWLFHLHSMVRTYRFFFSCSVYGFYGWGILLLILLGLKKAVS